METLQDYHVRHCRLVRCSAYEPCCETVWHTAGKLADGLVVFRHGSGLLYIRSHVLRREPQVSLLGYAIVTDLWSSQRYQRDGGQDVSTYGEAHISSSIFWSSLGPCAISPGSPWLSTTTMTPVLEGARNRPLDCRPSSYPKETRKALSTARVLGNSRPLASNTHQQCSLHCHQ